MCSGRESGLRVASGRRLSGMFRSGHALFLGGEASPGPAGRCDLRARQGGTGNVRQREQRG